MKNDHVPIIAALYLQKEKLRPPIELTSYGGISHANTAFEADDDRPATDKGAGADHGGLNGNRLNGDVILPKGLLSAQIKGNNNVDDPIQHSLNVVDLSYTVKVRPGHWWDGSCFRAYQDKLVLNHVCMTFQSGELTALVGASGAGKTSLLDILSGRGQGEISGDVTYKGHVCSREVMKKCSSYVLQSDRLLPTLTVREMLTYMAYLKLPGDYKAAQINKKVESLLLDMGLQRVADVRIGGSINKGVSGGEKRRITIGIQLLEDPDILLLDEPTSGLDAFTARHLVSSLSKLAHQGKMVIMSIHQPRSDIFNLLDKLAILTVGRLAFLGRPKELVPYFTSIGHPCPLNQNPCDVYIDLTSVDRRTKAKEEASRDCAVSLCDTFLKSDLQKVVMNQLNNVTTDGQRTDEILQTTLHDRAHWTRIFICIFSRMNLHLWRDKSGLFARTFLSWVFTPFILAFIGKMKDNQESIQDRLGVLYQAEVVALHYGFINAMGQFQILRDIYYRECNDGLYSPLTFMLVYFLHVLPTNIISMTGFTLFLYWMGGFHDGFQQFVEFLVIMIGLQQFGELITALFMGLFRGNTMAHFSTTMVLRTSVLFGTGLLRSTEKMPGVIKWISHITIHRYTTNILAYNEFHNISFSCNENETAICLRTGEDVLDVYFPDAEDEMTRNWITSACFFLSCWLLAAAVYKIRGNPILH